MKRKQAGRTMQITHRGVTIMVKEDHAGSCVLKFDDHRQPTDKKFPAACREALTWLLAHAGDMRGNYERSEA